MPTYLDRLPQRNLLHSSEPLNVKGFPAFILTPAEGAADGWYRVQVGPFHDPPEAQDAKRNSIP